MTAAELNAIATDAAERTAMYEYTNEQAKATGRIYELSGWSLPAYTAREARQRESTHHAI